MKTEQRFNCNVCGKSWTGMKMEHCKVCHQTFNDTRAGDKHRITVGNYTVIKLEDGTLQHIADDAIVPYKAKVVSMNNQERICLDAAGMRAKGMNQEKNGAWNNGGNWTPSIYKSQEVLSLPA